jgi:hypothetical protein
MEKPLLSGKELSDGLTTYSPLNGLSPISYIRKQQQ